MLSQWLAKLKRPDANESESESTEVEMEEKKADASLKKNPAETTASRATRRSVGNDKERETENSKENGHDKTEKKKEKKSRWRRGKNTEEPPEEPASPLQSPPRSPPSSTEMVSLRGGNMSLFYQRERITDLVLGDKDDGASSIAKETIGSDHPLKPPTKVWMKRNNSMTFSDGGSESDGGQNDPEDEELMFDGPKKLKRHGEGAFKGVFVPCTSAVLGTILFLRLPAIVGYCGMGLMMLLLFLAILSATLTWISLGAISRNGVVTKGGVYHIISRAFGGPLGGSVGVIYYFGLCLMCAMHILAAAEVVLHISPSLHIAPSYYWDYVLYGNFFLIPVLLIVLLSIRFVSIAEVMVLIVVCISILAITLGFLVPPDSDREGAGVLGLGKSKFGDYWGPDFSGSFDFFVALGLFFPSVTGIMAGLNRAGDLKHAHFSIPWGTLAAIGVTFVVYLYFSLFLCATVERSVLKEDHFIEETISWPTKWLARCGIILATLGEGLQALFTAPRILQGITRDKLFWFLKWFRSPSKKIEPRRELILTYFFVFCFLFFGKLENIAPLISILLLLAYAFINLACFLYTILRTPHFRPNWKYHWSASLSGFLVCLVLMFMISWWFSVICISITVVLFFYLHWRGDSEDWGDGLKGLRLQNALQSLLAVENQGFTHTRNWRPQILALIKLLPDGTPTHPELLQFCQQLKKGKGLLICAAIMEGKFQEMADIAEFEKKELMKRMRGNKLDGFAEIVISSSFLEGISALVQRAGLGQLSPNTIVLGWPYPWRTEGKWADTFVETLRMAEKAEMAILVAKGLRNFPTFKMRMNGTIDLWWIVHDGGLELMIGHLLQMHKVWKACKLRVFAVAEMGDDTDTIKKQLKHMLFHWRISAIVTVVEMEMTDMAPYTFDRDEKAQSRHKLLETLHVKLDLDPDEVEERAHHHHNPVEAPSDHDKLMELSGHLNKTILKYSAEQASLFMINLPTPLPDHSSEDYMEYMEVLTEGMKRVILIRGSGYEVITHFA